MALTHHVSLLFFCHALLAVTVYVGRWAYSIVCVGAPGNPDRAQLHILQVCVLKKKKKKK